MGKRRDRASRSVILLFLVLFGLIFSAITALFASARAATAPGMTPDVEAPVVLPPVG